MEQKLFFTHPLKTKLCGILNDAGGDTSTPVIIIVHGFTSSKDSKSYVPLVNNLTQAGVATFRIDLYGHGESEGEFRDVTISKGRDSVLAAIEFLKSKGYSNIGLLGSSFGGISSIMAAAQSKDLFCLALKSPVTDWLKVTFPSQPGLLEKWKQQGFIHYSDHDDHYEELSYNIVEDAKKQIAFNVVDLITIPTLVVHGNADEVVPFEGSQKFIEMLADGELYSVEGTNHQYSINPGDFEEMTKVLSAFLIQESLKQKV